ncbi:MAG: alpha/beta fold hydrolase [Actinomycetota bacterium]|nr:alpha/beta fold hydrolase [Actinomycetota bacterium]
MTTVRTRWFGPSSSDTVVAVLPGLGLPSYVTPLADDLARRGVACAVLDLPGFGSRAGLVCAPDVIAMGEAAAEWVSALAPTRRVVVLGHSTGAQAALGTAISLQHDRPDSALVLCAPTFHPDHRGLLGLARATSTAYRRDSPKEVVVVPDLVRGNVDVARIVRSGMRDRPEVRITRLELPVLLTAGRADTYAPPAWLERLAAAAGRSPWVTTAVLDGSHNNLYTHGEALAGVILDAVG